MTGLTAAARRLYDVLASPLEGQALYDAIEAAHHQLGAALQEEAGMGNVRKLEGRALPARPNKTKGAAKMPKRWEVSPHAVQMVCNMCGLERSELAFPKQGRVCVPQGIPWNEAAASARRVTPDLGGAA